MNEREIFLRLIRKSFCAAEQRREEFNGNEIRKTEKYGRYMRMGFEFLSERVSIVESFFLFRRLEPSWGSTGTDSQVVLVCLEDLCQNGVLLNMAASVYI